MTFRTRTVSKPTRRRSRRSDTRRAIYVTVIFSLAIVIALSLLGGVFVAGYYSDHWAPMAAVNGRAISVDDVRALANVNIARYDRELADYATLRNQGKITSDEFSSFQTTIQGKQQTALSDSLTEIENEFMIRQYAAKNGITVDSQQIADQIKFDGTIDEMRHIMVIGIAPNPVAPAYAITADDEQRAQARAQALLDEVKGGKAWADVVTESNDYTIGTSGQTSDMGLVTKANATSIDPNLRDAVFQLANVNDVTGLFKESDGSYRFATVTEIVPEYVDPDWESSVTAKSSADVFHQQAEGEALKTAIQKSIEDKYITSPTTQRRVLELSVSPGYGQPGDGDEVAIKVIIFAPGGSTDNAAGLDPSDPKWADAKSKADAAYAEIQADPSKFATMAADKNVNNSYWQSYGGEIPWIPADLFAATTQTGNYGIDMPSVQQAVFAADVKPGDILGPIFEQDQGYVIVQLLGRRPAPDLRIAEAQFQINAGADFATVAQQVSETVDAANGAELGWVSPYQLDQVQQDAIFSTPVGDVTPMIDDNGYHIYKVLEEQTRVQNSDEQARLKDVVFARWLSDLQASALIWQDTNRVSALSSATP
jgi:hypothetical protein